MVYLFVAGWAALQFRQGVVDHGRVGDFFQRVLLLELGVRVSLRVLVADSCDFCVGRSADRYDHELGIGDKYHYQRSLPLWHRICIASG